MLCLSMRVPRLVSVSIMYSPDQDVVIGYTVDVSRCRRVASRERTRLCRVSVTLKADRPACQPVRATSPRRQRVTLCVLSPGRCRLQGCRPCLPGEGDVNLFSFCFFPFLFVFFFSGVRFSFFGFAPFYFPCVFFLFFFFAVLCLKMAIFFRSSIYFRFLSSLSSFNFISFACPILFFFIFYFCFLV